VKKHHSAILCAMIPNRRRSTGAPAWAVWRHEPLDPAFLLCRRRDRWFTWSPPTPGEGARTGLDGWLALMCAC